MVDVRITLAGLWISVMLTYLLGDVIRVFAGDFTSGQLGDKPASQAMWLSIAAIMLVPIVMIVLTLTMPFPAIRWTSMAVAAFQIVFNILGLPYPGHYDNFLILVSMVFCGMIIWFAWSWR